jgi:hypothetical protein
MQCVLEPTRNSKEFVWLRPTPNKERAARNADGLRGWTDGRREKSETALSVHRAGDATESVDHFLVWTVGDVDQPELEVFPIRRTTG